MALSPHEPALAGSCRHGEPCGLKRSLKRLLNRPGRTGSTG
jgi:hypothetical protein